MVLAIFFFALLFWMALFAAIGFAVEYQMDKDNKANGEKTQEELDKEFHDSIREMQDLFWQDGFERGYEKALEDMREALEDDRK